MLRLSLAFMPILKPQFAFPVLIALADHPSAVVTNSRDGGHPGFSPNINRNVCSVSPLIVFWM